MLKKFSWQIYVKHLICGTSPFPQELQMLCRQSAAPGGGGGGGGTAGGVWSEEVGGESTHKQYCKYVEATLSI